MEIMFDAQYTEINTNSINKILTPLHKKLEKRRTLFVPEVK